MDLALREDVKKLLDSVVWFANLNRIKSPEQITAKFCPLYENAWLRNSKNRPSLKSLSKWQKTTRLLLTIGVEYDRPSMAEDREWLDKTFSVFLQKELRAEAEFTFVDGEIRERMIVTPQTVWAFCRLGAILLIDRGRKYHKYLRICETCDRFILKWTRGKGAPAKYCSPECRLEGMRIRGVIRQREFRLKHRVSR